jgi:hypothetical protein
MLEARTKGRAAQGRPRSEREPDREARAALRGVRRLDRAAEAVGELGGQRQPEARARRAAVAVTAVEATAVEGDAEVLVGEAGAAVTYGEGQLGRGRDGRDGRYRR